MAQPLTNNDNNKNIDNSFLILQNNKASVKDGVLSKFKTTDVKGNKFSNIFKNTLNANTQQAHSKFVDKAVKSNTSSINKKALTPASEQPKTTNTQNKENKVQKQNLNSKEEIKEEKPKEKLEQNVRKEEKNVQDKSNIKNENTQNDEQNKDLDNNTSNNNLNTENEVDEKDEKGEKKPKKPETINEAVNENIYSSSVSASPVFSSNEENNKEVDFSDLNEKIKALNTIITDDNQKQTTDTQQADLQQSAKETQIKVENTAKSDNDTDLNKQNKQETNENLKTDNSLNNQDGQNLKNTKIEQFKANINPKQDTKEIKPNSIQTQVEPNETETKEKTAQTTSAQKTNNDSQQDLKIQTNTQTQQTPEIKNTTLTQNDDIKQNKNEIKQPIKEDIKQINDLINKLSDEPSLDKETLKSLSVKIDKVIENLENFQNNGSQDINTDINTDINVEQSQKIADTNIDIKELKNLKENIQNILNNNKENETPIVKTSNNQSEINKAVNQDTKTQIKDLKAFEALEEVEVQAQSEVQEAENIETSKKENIKTQNKAQNTALQTQNKTQSNELKTQNISKEEQPHFLDDSGALSAVDEISKMTIEKDGTINSKNTLNNILFESSSAKTPADTQINTQFNAQINNRLNNQIKAFDFEAVKNPFAEKLENSDILNQISNKITQDFTNKTQKINLVLRPNDLGRLSIELSSNKDGLTTNILAQNEQVRSYIEKNINNLRQQLTDAGINVNTIQIKTIGSNNSTKYQGDFNNNSQNQNTPQEQNNSQQNNEQNNSRQRQKEFENILSKQNYEMNFKKDFSNVFSNISAKTLYYSEN